MHSLRLFRFTVGLLLCTLSAPFAVAQEATGDKQPAAAVDRVGVPGPVRFDGRDYALAWSSNPEPTLFKQEYLPAGQALESFTDMIVIDVRPNTEGAVDTATKMVEMLKQRKATDPVVNYELLLSEETGEVLLDFLMSAPHEEGGIVVEWNAYRYRDTADGKGSIMLGISRRAYGDADARAFLKALKGNRHRDISALAGLDLGIRTP